MQQNITRHAISNYLFVVQHGVVKLILKIIDEYAQIACLPLSITVSLEGLLTVLSFEEVSKMDEGSW